MVIAAIGVVGYKFLGKSSLLPLSQGLNQTLTKEISVGDNVCAEFPKEFVAAAIGRAIIKTDKFDTNTLHNCQYFVDDTHYAMIKVEELSVENQRLGQEAMGRTIKQDPRILMDHMVAWQDANTINEIYLILSPTRYVGIDRNFKESITNEQEVALAVAVVGRITKGENQGSSSTTTPQVTENKTVTAGADEKPTITSFFGFIAGHKPSEAVGMLASQLTADDADKQAWAVQFNAFQSLSVTSVEEVSTADWTDTSHIYKVILNVTMKPEATAATPIPNYGWENGSNTRWVTLEKDGSVWKIAGIATGP